MTQEEKQAIYNLELAAARERLANARHVIASQERIVRTLNKQINWLKRLAYTEGLDPYGL